LGVSLISSEANGLVGGTSHSVKIFGQVFGESSGVSLGRTVSPDTTSIDGITLFSQGNISGNFVGITFSGFTSILVNYGHISGDNYGIMASNPTTYTTLSITNYGEISSYYVALSINQSVKLNLKNFGNISTDAQLAIASSGGPGDRIYNHGSISGGIQLGAGSDIVTNRGLITGSVGLGDGGNLLDNQGGTIEGDITFGAGNDTFKPGVGVETAIGGGGTDTLDFTRSGAVQIALDESILATGAAKDDSYTGFENIIGSKSGSDVLTGDANANVLSGLGGADVLNGFGGRDTLIGGTGADTMSGGADSDFYYVDNVGDIMLENAGSGTADCVLASVSFALAADDDIELLMTTYLVGTGAINLTGNDLAQAIYGNAGANILSGLGGADTLIGGAGLDTLTGGSGIDRFQFGAAVTGNGDRITDFLVGVDKLVFAASDYGLVAGPLAAANFTAGTTAVGAAAQFIYNSAAKTMSWDADGNGAGLATLVATFDTAVALTTADFVLV
jgi:Ca2+-binding RTX toxin-like protein